MANTALTIDQFMASLPAPAGEEVGPVVDVTGLAGTVVTIVFRHDGLVEGDIDDSFAIWGKGASAEAQARSVLDQAIARARVSHKRDTLERG